jgi:hypothetical protein
MDFKSFGNYETKFVLYIGLFIAIILILCGTVIFIRNENNLIDTIGTITKSMCSAYQNNSGTMYNCVLTVTYSSNNSLNRIKGQSQSRTESISIQDNSTFYEREIIFDDTIVHNKGEKIELTYDVNNPVKVTNKIMRSNWTGLSICCLGLLIILIIVLNYYIIYYVSGDDNLNIAPNNKIDTVKINKPNISKITPIKYKGVNVSTTL